MNRILLFLFAILFAIPLEAQQHRVTYCDPSTNTVCRSLFDTVPTVTASGAAQTVNVQGFGALTHQVSWTSSATPASISVVVAASTGTTYVTLNTSTSGSGSYTFSGAYQGISVTTTVGTDVTVDSTYVGSPAASARLGTFPLTAASVPFVDANGNLTQDNSNFNYTDSTNTLNVASIASGATAFTLKTSSGNVTAMTVGTDQKVGITTTTSIGTDSTVGTALNLGGTVTWSGWNTTAGALAGAVCRATTNEIEINTNAGGCLVSSERFKNHIAPMKHGLDWIARLQPITWNWNDPAEAGPIVG